MKKTITLLSIVLLSGCSWADGWFDDRPPPPQPRNAALQMSPSTPVAIAAPVRSVTDVAMTDHAASVRIAQLEAEVAALRNDIKMMMPALTKLATSQTDLLYVTDALQRYEPAAGAAQPAAMPVNQPQAQPAPHEEVPPADALLPAASAAPQNNREQPASTQKVSRVYSPIGAPRSAVISEAAHSNPRPLTPAPEDFSETRATQGTDNAGTLRPMNNIAARNEETDLKRRALMEKKTAQLLQGKTMSPDKTSHAGRVVANAQQAIEQTSRTPAQIDTVPRAAFDKSEVKAVRLGEYDDKTRFVVDLENETDFTYDVDNSENLILVDFPKAGWNTKLQKNLAASPLVHSYKAVSDGNGGTSLAIQLKAPAQVLWAETLPANGEKSPRVVLDIARI